MIGHIEIERSPKALEKRDRSWLHLLPLYTACHRLANVMMRRHRDPLAAAGW